MRGEDAFHAFLGDVERHASDVQSHRGLARGYTPVPRGAARVHAAAAAEAAAEAAAAMLLVALTLVIHGASAGPVVVPVFLLDGDGELRKKRQEREKRERERERERERGGDGARACWFSSVFGGLVSVRWSVLRTCAPWGVTWHAYAILFVMGEFGGKTTKTTKKKEMKNGDGTARKVYDEVKETKEKRASSGSCRR